MPFPKPIYSPLQNWKRGPVNTCSILPNSVMKLGAKYPEALINIEWTEKTYF